MEAPGLAHSIHAFTFFRDCLYEQEARGLNDQGLSRIVSVISKVKKLLNQALDLAAPGNQPDNISDHRLWPAP